MEQKMIVTQLRNALINSFDGIKQTWKQERAFRLEILACACILPITFWSEAPSTHKLFVIFSLSLVLITELINTSIEKANVALKKTFDPLIKHSKNAASAGVFLALCLVGISLLNLFL